ncbi:hypothetical protein GCM10011487_37030 [Steroidobacter agaridevorans]|uniref:Uncharacterized protein n=1 Tax=Steroidobacter agaridevorans TaxID=2695856 RepID=A0A829YFL3_9GAMM|nr:hypothetical protein [Steroidobacter agaridevorans]GFE81703.1 hypothetical protein GCM10011487_37030 [Steroidobacter agaridevorans]GFE90447.1 hypothetical protein GCM10011488_54010 [Steroidobacter agaridevorans]
MDRFSAAAQVAAFFLVALMASPLARACEDCERTSHEQPTGRVDVTAAVDAATSFVIKALRSLYPSYKVSIVEGDAVDTTPTVAEYAATYDARDGQSSVELPGFRHRYAWQLTYRDEADRVQGADVTLDDSYVLGLRFELDYGWKR